MSRVEAAQEYFLLEVPILVTLHAHLDRKGESLSDGKEVHVERLV